MMVIDRKVSDAEAALAVIVEQVIELATDYMSTAHLREPFKARARALAPESAAREVERLRRIEQAARAVHEAFIDPDDSPEITALRAALDVAKTKEE